MISHLLQSVPLSNPSDIQCALFVHIVEHLVERDLSSLQIFDPVEFEGCCGSLFGKLVKRVVKHDLIVIFKGQLEDEVQEGLELAQSDLNLLFCVSRAKNANAEFDLLCHGATAQNDKAC